MSDEQILDNQGPETAQAAPDLQVRVAELEEQLAAAQDQSLRVAADLQNIRRRAEQDVEKARAWVQVCLRGLNTMDAEAELNPDNLLPPQIWDCEVDGDNFCVIRDGRQHQRAARLRPGSRIYTMREVAVALKAMQTAVVDSVKDIFLGAEIVGTKKTEQPIDDSLDGLFD